MKRIGVALILLAAILTSASSCDEAVEAQTTGVTVRCANCLTFEVHVWIDSNFMDAISSEEPATFEISSGSHTLYARSNAKNEENNYWCWTLDFSVGDGSITTVILDCIDAECTDTGN